MSIPGGGVTRVSNSLKAFSLLTNLRANSLEIFRQQNRIATGQRLLSVSDDPIGAERIAAMQKSLESQEQILRNLQHADSHLAATDNSITDIHNLLIDASRIASEQASNLQTGDERAAQGLIIDSIISQIQSIGNQQFQGLYLFGGRSVYDPPFSDSIGRVSYVGDTGQRQTLVDPKLAQAFNLPASDLFGLQSRRSGGYGSFDLQLSGDTRLSELGGAQNAGLRLGPIRVTEAAPPVTFDTNFSGCATVADVMARFNADASAAGSTLSMSISGHSLRISSGGGSAIQVQDIGNGTMAADLGLAPSSPSPMTGGDLHRRITTTTAVSDLGPGFALNNGVTITNGTLSANVSLAGATTVGQVLNRLNSAGMGIRASLNDAGTAIVIENQIAGTDLRIGENGGNDGELLGIRTMNNSTSVSALNGGRGLHTVSGADLHITDANGVAFDVDLDGTHTIGDVINAINTAATAAGSSIVAQRSPTGGGLRLTGAAGAGTISVERANLSPAASELGILRTGSATALNGDDVVSFRQSGLFSALYRLRDALMANDTSEITQAGADLDQVQKDVINVQGIVGSRSRAMQSRRQQTEDAVASTTILLSEVKDVDITEAITKFQQAQTALQAAILSGNQSLNTSLLDFLR